MKPASKPYIKTTLHSQNLQIKCVLTSKHPIDTRASQPRARLFILPRWPKPRKMEKHGNTAPWEKDRERDSSARQRIIFVRINKVTTWKGSLNCSLVLRARGSLCHPTFLHPFFTQPGPVYLAPTVSSNRSAHPRRSHRARLASRRCYRCCCRCPSGKIPGYEPALEAHWLTVVCCMLRAFVANNRRRGLDQLDQQEEKDRGCTRIDGGRKREETSGDHEQRLWKLSASTAP